MPFLDDGRRRLEVWEGGLGPWVGDCPALLRGDALRHLLTTRIVYVVSDHRLLVEDV